MGCCFAAAARATPSRENQEPQEAPSSDGLFFCRTFEIFRSLMSSNANLLKLWYGAVKDMEKGDMFISQPRDMQILRPKYAFIDHHRLVPCHSR